MFEHFIGKAYILDEPPAKELREVDLPLISQRADTPEQLLLQMDREDLSDESKDRIEYLDEQEILSEETLKRNNSVEPDQQLSLAREIETRATSCDMEFLWRANPSYDELKAVTKLIWDHLVSSGEIGNGAVSGDQLTYKIWQLRKNSPRRIILDEIGDGETPTAAVQSTIDFMRTWAGFRYPRYLRAFHWIQREVLRRLQRRLGSYLGFAQRVECYFTTPTHIALEEYGLPIQATNHLQSHLPRLGDLDATLERLQKEIDSNVLDDPFEKELLEDLKASLSSTGD